MWIKYIGRVIVNTGLFFVIFATLSITGVLVEDMQWKWAVEKWAYVFEGGLRADQLRKKMDNSKFPKGSYEKYINPHTNGNLAASDEVSACVFKDQIYLAIPDNLIIIKRDNKKDKEKQKRISYDVSQSALIGGKRYILAVDEAAFQVAPSYAGASGRDSGFGFFYQPGAMGFGGYDHSHWGHIFDRRSACAPADGFDRAGGSISCLSSGGRGYLCFS